MNNRRMAATIAACTCLASVAASAPALAAHPATAKPPKPKVYQGCDSGCASFYLYAKTKTWSEGSYGGRYVTGKHGTLDLIGEGEVQGVEIRLQKVKGTKNYTGGLFDGEESESFTLTYES